jgi:hypothetical protein
MSHLPALIRVWFDLSVFKRVVEQRGRRTFAFLLLLVLLSTVAGTVSIMIALRDAARKVDPYLDQIPTITIKDGKASADVPQPWVKRFDRDENGNTFVLIIDTTGQREDFGHDEIGVFVKRETVIVKQPDQRREMELSKFPDMVIGPHTVREAIKSVLRRAPYYIGAFLLVYFFLIKLMQALLLVLPALIGASGRRPPLGFGQLFGVAVYALAPAVLLDCVLDFLPVHVPHFWLVYFALAATYAVLGARRASDEPEAPTPL